jgi:1-phosphatidylinositol phosphodiesterase
MAALTEETPLGDIILPGTHDSATQYVQLAFFSKCQSLSIAQQLEAGFRYLDIRLGDVKKGADYPPLMHGFTNCKTGPLGGTLTLDQVLADCYAFLAQHPTETVIFTVKHEHGDSTAADFQRTLQGFTAAREANWLLTDTLPTLGEARGKLVLLRRYEDEAGLGERSGVPFLWEDQKGHEDTTQNTEQVEQGSYSLWVQDRFEYGLEDKWTAFEKGMDEADAQKAEGDIVLSFLSTKGTASYGHPWRYAKDLNARLLKTGDLTGWVVLDFLDARLAYHLYSMNFK